MFHAIYSFGKTCWQKAIFLPERSYQSPNFAFLCSYRTFWNNFSYSKNQLNGPVLWIGFICLKARKPLRGDILLMTKGTFNCNRQFTFSHHLLWREKFSRNLLLFLIYAQMVWGVANLCSIYGRKKVSGHQDWSTKVLLQSDYYAYKGFFFQEGYIYRHLLNIGFLKFAVFSFWR